MSADVESMVSVREVPWHGLGTIVQDQLTAADAMKEAGLDWFVIKQPIFTKIDGKQHEIPGRFANVRDTDDRILGIVGQPYVPLQNKDAFAFADALVDSGEAKYETAGSLKNGRWVWLMMQVPKTVLIAGEDAVELYLLVFNSHDGSKAVTAAVTPVRVVCRNTLNLALGTSRRTWSVRHVGTMDGKLEEARRALELTFAYADDFEQVMNQLAAEKFSERQYKNLVEKISPNEKVKEGLLDAYRTSETVEGIKETKYGALNIVGEYGDWFRQPKTIEAQLIGSWQGPALKLRDKALAVMTA